MNITTRQFYFLQLIYCTILLAVSFILQFAFHLEPCPLCIIARIIVIMLTIFFIIAVLHNPRSFGQKVYALLGTILSLLGVFVTTRHVWIMHLPAERMPDCGPGFQYLIDNLHPVDAMMIILRGSGECAQNNAAFLGLSLPAWTLIAFIILTIACIYSWHVKQK